MAHSTNNPGAIVLNSILLETTYMDPSTLESKHNLNYKNAHYIQLHQQFVAGNDSKEAYLQDN